ncbi:MFS transporter [Conexibacter sp. W3-3-2]|uniref:MFS transporter n=1 Tax=Conexibacter sp. W3-3-2 TaxID=2675227 RepID=UPI001328DEA8|nr:MFS transporter [Conexibacter sp. W3-3-2]MTD46430.1 MFS transporter [Conexibacter sp. W3-3-2]
MSGAHADAGARGAVQRRVLRVLLLAQVLAGAGLAAGITVGALLAEDMLGTTSAAGVPAALLTGGAAAAALLVARLSDRSGRRPGLAAGYAVGAVGAAGVVVAAAIDHVPLLFVALVLYGSGSATNLQARYAGADLADPERRGRAVSTVLVATTLGAVIGPNLVEPTGSLARELGIRELAGPFLLAGSAYALAAVAVAVLLRPDPLLTARAWAAEEAAAPPTAAAPTATDAAAARAADAQAQEATATLRLAAAGMIVTQLVMVAVMTMTPVHMRDHGHGVGAAGFVISLHVAAMFLPSPLTGQLVDRVGRRPVLAAGSATLVLAGGVAALAPADSVGILAVALVLLGLGWNLGLVAGTALVTDAVPLAERARTQGRVDLGVALAGATGGMGSGFVVAATDYVGLALLGGVLALCLLPALLVARGPAVTRPAV